MTYLVHFIATRPGAWRLALLTLSLVLAACQQGDPGGGADPGGGGGAGGDGY